MRQRVLGCAISLLLLPHGTGAFHFPHPAQGACCRCGIATVGGRRTWICPCIYDQGGFSCTITSSNCFVNGTCPNLRPADGFAAPAAADGAAAARQVWDAAEALSDMLMSGQPLAPIELGLDLLSRVLNEARFSDARAGSNGSWLIPFDTAYAWIQLRVVPESNGRFSCDVVLTLPCAGDRAACDADSRQLLLNCLMNDAGMEVFTLHVQNWQPETPQVAARLRHKALLTGGGYRVTRTASDWVGIFLGLAYAADGAATTTTSFGDCIPTRGALDTASGVRDLEVRMLALVR